MHEILLHIIDGPGSGLTCMVLGVLAMIVALRLIKAVGKSEYEEGKSAARREGLEQVQVTLARLVSDSEKGKYIE